MPEPKKQKIGVIGGGLMGHGIAYLFAAAGHPVGLFEPMAEIRNSLPKRLQAIVALFGDDSALLQRIETHEQLAPAVKGAAFVFEAAPEKLPLKQKIFAELESAVAPDTILASNSSAIPLDRDRPRSQASRARRRHAFLESAAFGASGRGHPERKDQRRRGARDDGLVAQCRKNPGPRAPRYSGLRRQSPAARHEARGDRAGRRRRLRCRDHRHRRQGRIRRAHGSAWADGAIRSGRVEPHARYRGSAYCTTSIVPRARIRSSAKKSRPANSA